MSLWKSPPPPPSVPLSPRLGPKDTETPPGTTTTVRVPCPSESRDDPSSPSGRDVPPLGPLLHTPRPFVRTSRRDDTQSAPRDPLPRALCLWTGFHGVSPTGGPVGTDSDAPVEGVTVPRGGSGDAGWTGHLLSAREPVTTEVKRRRLGTSLHTGLGPGLATRSRTTEDGKSNLRGLLAEGRPRREPGVTGRESGSTRHRTPGTLRAPRRGRAEDGQPKVTSP